MTAKPDWFRLDVGFIDNPKIIRAHDQAGPGAIILWLQGLAYSTKNLTDGWIPLPMPKRWGYNGKQSNALTNTGLWIPLEITDDGGWLINDYAEYQVTRVGWDAKIKQRKDASRKRWGGI